MLGFAEDCLIVANKADPDAASHLGLQCLPKHLLMSCPYKKKVLINLAL